MNDDPFETRLQGLRRRELAAEWKACILAAAAPHAQPPRVLLSPPRWLAWGLAAIWTLVLILSVTTPSRQAQEPLLTADHPDAGIAIQQRQELFAALLSTSTLASP